MPLLLLAGAVSALTPSKVVENSACPPSDGGGGTFFHYTIQTDGLLIFPVFSWFFKFNYIHLPGLQVVQIVPVYYKNAEKSEYHHHGGRTPRPG